MNTQQKNNVTFIVIAVLVCAAIFGGISASRNLGKTKKTISKESAEKILHKRNP